MVWGRGRCVAVSAGHTYVGGTRGSDILSCADDMLGMSVVRGMRGVVRNVYVFVSGWCVR